MWSNQSDNYHIRLRNVGVDYRIVFAWCKLLITTQNRLRKDRDRLSPLAIERAYDLVNSVFLVVFY